MLKLHGNISGSRIGLPRPTLLTLTENTILPDRLKKGHALLSSVSRPKPSGFGAYLDRVDNSGNLANQFTLGQEFDYLAGGDIVRIDPRGKLACLYRRNANYNTILLTEQCNHYCLMCSQPPKAVDDSWLLGQAMQLLEMIPRDTKILGFSGGEPTLYGDGLVDLLRKAKNYLPTTMLDVLTNGRAFKSIEYCEKMQQVGHDTLMFAIPLYSDDPVTHDYVVQSEGAYDEAIAGILNLKSCGQKVEIRIVIHKQTVDRLVSTCEFISRNLLFVDHVALMGLEITGFTRANLQQLWIDPHDYKDQLSQATEILNRRGIPTSVYNHQLCVINDDVLENYKRSISSWKNEYVAECDSCLRRSECGGFFSSSKMYRFSDHIQPFQ
jgi:His-Xaa-Ser system radical SAM maturase HxsC